MVLKMRWFGLLPSNMLVKFIKLENARQKMTNYQRMNYALAIAFARGLLDGEQLEEFLTIYRGGK